MKQAEWSEGTFQSLLDSAPDSLVVVDSSGRIILVNAQTEKNFGYTRNELINEPVEILLPDRYRNKHVGQRNRYISAPHARPMGAGLELFGRRKDGSEFPVEISLSPVQTERGLLTTGAIRDVTEQKKIEFDLRKARELADAASRAKSEFLANMSHEIRTPLAGILGYVEMLTQYGKTDEARQDYAVKIKRCAENLTALINDILDLSKVEAGALKIERTRSHLATEVESVVSVLNGTAVAKGIELEVTYQSSLPTYIITDSTRLRQVLLNVLGNAVKFTERGIVSMKVKLHPEPNKLLFTISDTGCGISEADQGKLFRPFVQADSSLTRKFGGTGLGLALSRKLAVALNGDLSLLASAPEKGSTFQFSMDIGTEEERASKEFETVSGFNATEVGEISLKGFCVLLAEDRQENEELITQFLTHVGAEVAIAKNGKQALEMAGKNSYDVILMDIQMPVMDGHESARQLRSRGIKTPIVALTAHAMIEEKEKCIQSGFNGYLTKPIDSELLVRTVYRFKK